jgi:glycosyltransferase involved in cell wall biosynthesis
VARRLTVVQMLPALESGGVERGTLEIGRGLVAAGHRSIVISAGGRMVDQLVAEGSEHVAWDVGRKRLTTLRWIPKLRRLLADERVDVLHLRSRLPAWIGYLAWRGMDPANRPKLVTTVHGFYSVSRYSAIMTRGERVIAVSEAIRDYVLQNYPDVDPERIEVIHRGIDPEQFPRGFTPSADWLSTWQAEFPQLDGKRVLTLPGRLTRLKGHADFLELIATLRREGREVHGLIVGEAQAGKEAYAAELRAQVSALGLEEDVTFAGHRDDMREIYAISEAVLSLSTQAESFGRTVAEALAIGTPVIGYASGGVEEILRRFYPEGVVGPGDIEALADRARSLVDGHMPQVELPVDWTLARMVASTLELYEKVCMVPVSQVDGGVGGMLGRHGE